jgi:tRNA threonylcarbamoyladenosine biosynthesis protein TsaB
MVEIPNILYIEASTDVCSVCIARGSDLISLREDNGSRAHSHLLATYIKECMEEAKISAKNLHAICLSGGPGSYTSLRISAGIAKGISFAVSVPIIALNSLDVYYYGVKNRDKYDVIASLIDARREDVYMKLFDSYNNVITDTCALTLHEDILKSYINKKVLICGNASGKSEKYFPFAQISEINSPKASYMVEHGLELWQSKTFENTVDYVPFYLKSPNITQSSKKLL